MIINCIIVEDEPLSLKRTLEYVSKISYLNLLKAFDNGLDAISYLKQHQVDLLFLDIQMDELSGIQLLESLSNKPQVIFTTAYEEYALKGYELNVSDYLIKPFTLERFIQAVDKVYNYLDSERKSSGQDLFFVKTEYRIEKVSFRDVLYIEGMRDYRNIQTLQKKILTHQTFKELEEELPYNKFCRVHKSYLVSLDKIELIERNRIRINEKLIPISDTYKKRFYNLINLKSNG